MKITCYFECSIYSNQYIVTKTVLLGNNNIFMFNKVVREE